jgi:hypothetical protein
MDIEDRSWLQSEEKLFSNSRTLCIAVHSLRSDTLDEELLSSDSSPELPKLVSERIFIIIKPIYSYQSRKQ